MDVLGDDNGGNGTSVDLWGCADTGGQTWAPRVGGNMDGTLYNPQSGMCLDDPNGDTANGTTLRIWECNGAGGQKFTIT